MDRRPVVERVPVEELAGLRTEWSTLCDRSAWTTPFQRPEWMLPWLRTFPPWEPWILAAREGGRLVGLLPLFLYLKDGVRTLAMAGAGYSDYLDVVMEPGREALVLAALLSYLEERAALWAACDLEQLRPSSPLLEMALPDGWSESTAPQDACPLLELPEDPAALREVVPSRMMFNLRHFRRKMEALGDFRLARAGADDWPLFFDSLLAMHRARWQERGVPSVLADLAVERFHREVIPGFLAREALDLLTLRLDGRTVAIYYGFREREVAYGYLQGFDAEWARYSPGAFVVGAALEEVIRRGARRYDFLRGQEAYKYRWGAVDRWNHRRTLRRVAAASGAFLAR